MFKFVKGMFQPKTSKGKKNTEKELKQLKVEKLRLQNQRETLLKYKSEGKTEVMGIQIESSLQYAELRLAQVDADIALFEQVVKHL